MRRLLALTLGAAALAAAPVQADPTQFPRRCEGKFDMHCYDQFCGIASCVTSDCVVFFDPDEGYNTSTCIGKPRPGPGDPHSR